MKFMIKDCLTYSVLILKETDLTVLHHAASNCLKQQKKNKKNSQ